MSFSGHIYVFGFLGEALRNMWPVRKGNQKELILRVRRFQELLDASRARLIFVPILPLISRITPIETGPTCQFVASKHQFGTLVATAPEVSTPT
jgi:hypothetical protein